MPLEQLYSDSMTENKIREFTMNRIHNGMLIPRDSVQKRWDMIEEQGTSTLVARLHHDITKEESKEEDEDINDFTMKY